MTPEIMSIEIRPGVFVRIHGIPYDLTPEEAGRLANVIRALGSAPFPTKHQAEEKL